MEDSHLCDLKLASGLSLFGVFDGHGGNSDHFNKILGKEVALYVKKNYAKVLSTMTSFKQGNYRVALEESFLKIDNMMQTEKGHQELMKLQHRRGSGDSTDLTESSCGSMAGCTATVVLITPKDVWCCNAGDSRTVMSKNE